MFTRFTLIAFCIMTLPAHSFHGWDYNFVGLLRTYPLAGGVAAQGGYGYLMWGENKPGDYLYGYVRPVVTVATSTRTHSYDGMVQIYPVSFLGFEGGYGQSFRYANPFFVDCDNNHCQGRMSRSFWRIFLAAGAGDFFGIFAAKRTRLTHEQNDKSFVDEFSQLHGKVGGDLLQTYEYGIGYKIDDFKTLLLFQLSERMLESQATSRFTGLVGRWSVDPFIFVAGVGAYQSSTAPLGFTSLISMKWIGSPAVNQTQ